MPLGCQSDETPTLHDSRFLKSGLSRLWQASSLEAIPNTCNQSWASLLGKEDKVVGMKFTASVAASGGLIATFKWFSGLLDVEFFLKSPVTSRSRNQNDTTPYALNVY